MLRFHLPPRRRSYLREGATEPPAWRPNRTHRPHSLRFGPRLRPARLRPASVLDPNRREAARRQQRQRVPRASLRRRRLRRGTNLPKTRHRRQLEKTTSTPNPTRTRAIRSGLRPSRQFRPSFRLFVSTSARRASGIRPVPSPRASTEATRRPGRRRPTLSRPPPPPFSSSRPPPRRNARSVVCSAARRATSVNAPRDVSFAAMFAIVWKMNRRADSDRRDAEASSSASAAEELAIAEWFSPITACPPCRLVPSPR